MKYIIAGSRHFNRYSLLMNSVNHIIGDDENVVIINGGARGADAMGKRYAREKNYPCITVHADWKAFGKSAGYLRNERMAQMGDYLIAFWDGESPGTKHMIDLAKQYGLSTAIVRI